MSVIGGDGILCNSSGGDMFRRGGDSLDSTGGRLTLASGTRIHLQLAVVRFQF